jgi:hypothetical protein
MQAVACLAMLRGIGMVRENFFGGIGKLRHSVLRPPIPRAAGSGLIICQYPAGVNPNDSTLSQETTLWWQRR